jgi:hypothetical protein
MVLTVREPSGILDFEQVPIPFCCFYSVVPVGESNRRAMLKSRKLLILQIAINAKTARKVFRGYAAATRNVARDFDAGRNRATRNFVSNPKTS